MLNALQFHTEDYDCKHNFIILTLPLCILFILNIIKKYPFQCCWPLWSLWPKETWNSLQEQDGSALSHLAKASILMTLSKQGRQSHCLELQSFYTVYSCWNKLKQSFGSNLNTGAKGFKWLFFSACNSLWLVIKEGVYRSFAWDEVRSFFLDKAQRKAFSAGICLL